MSRSLQPKKKLLQPNSQPKVGLLGPYQALSREQLIEKLLVAEDLMKKLYKENKELKEKLHNQINR